MDAADRRSRERFRLKDTPAADDLERAENVVAEFVEWVRRKLR